jgi:hypothetical protein
MDTANADQEIRDVATLERLYGAPAGAAVEKETACIDRSDLPSLGTIIPDISKSRIDAKDYDSGLYERLKSSLC